MATYDPSVGGCGVCRSFHGCCCPSDEEMFFRDGYETYMRGDSRSGGADAEHPQLKHWLAGWDKAAEENRD